MAGMHQSDPVRRRRLRWRCRRGMLENDLILTRFLDRYEQELTDDEVAAVDALMELSDNALLDLILGREERIVESDPPATQAVLERLRAV